MPLWSVISRFQNDKYKGKCKGKGKCIRKWFLCPKCGIYLLNAALKRIFSISECKYKGKCKGKGKCIGKWFLCPKCGIYLLNADFEAWFLDFRMQIQRQNAKCKGKCIGKWFLCPKCGIYLLNAALKRDFSISECKYKGKYKYKGKCKCKGKCIGKWFLCPKCGIYLLNAALKRDFLDFRMQIQRQMQRLRQMQWKMVFMP